MVGHHESDMMAVFVFLASILFGLLVHKATWRKTVLKGYQWSRITCYIIGTISVGLSSVPLLFFSRSTLDFFVGQGFIVFMFGSGVVIGYLTDSDNGTSLKIANMHDEINELVHLIASLFRRHGHV